MLHDYIPRAYDAFLQWLKNLLLYIVENSERLQVDNGQRIELEVQIAAFEALCLKADSPSASKVDKADRKEMARELDKFVRNFINENLRYNRNVTDHDRREMGLPIRDTTPTTIPPPTVVPTLAVTIVGPRRLAVNFYDGEGHSKAKPYGTNGAVIAWSVADEQPATQDDLSHTALATRTPHTVEFPETDRGRTVFFAICWQNERGQRGPWSEFQTTIIP